MLKPRSLWLKGPAKGFIVGLVTVHVKALFHVMIPHSFDKNTGCLPIDEVLMQPDKSVAGTL
jgi:hypothetical protein